MRIGPFGKTRIFSGGLSLLPSGREGWDPPGRSNDERCPTAQRSGFHPDVAELDGQPSLGLGDGLDPLRDRDALQFLHLGFRVELPVTKLYRALQRREGRVDPDAPEVRRAPWCAWCLDGIRRLRSSFDREQKQEHDERQAAEERTSFPARTF